MSYTETEILELKRELTSDIKKEIIAFANTKGGTIYIGIDDFGNAIGINNIARECERLSSMINDGIKPDITSFISITNIKENNLDVIKISVTRGTYRPYYLADKGLKPSGVYIRLGNTSVPGTDQIIRSLIKENDGINFEDLRSLNQELTFNEAENIFNSNHLAFEKSQQRTLGIIGEDDLYTNLGLLISDQCQHTIKVAIFSEELQDEFQDRREFFGSLFKQLSDTFEFLNQYNRLHTTYEGLVRKEIKDYSELVLRESLLNAIIHRDYSFSGSILIRLFPNRIEIVSLGGLVAGFTLEDILLGISQPRNTKLASLFYRLKYIEAYGTGLRKILDDYLNYSLKPEFKITENAFRLTIPNKTKVVAQNEEIQNQQEDIMTLKLIQLLESNKPMSRVDIQNNLNIKQTTCINFLNMLHSEGKIRKIGNSKNTRYTI